MIQTPLQRESSQAVCVRRHGRQSDALLGAIEGQVAQGLVGWVCETRPADGTEYELIEGGVTVARFALGAPRHDLADIGLGEAPRAFFAPLPDGLFNDRERDFGLRRADDGKSVAGARRRVYLSAEALPKANLLAGASAASRIVGWTAGVVGLRNRQLQIRVSRKADAPSRTLVLDLLIDDIPFDRVSLSPPVGQPGTATVQRQVPAILRRDAEFVQLLDGAVHRFSLRETASAHELAYSMLRTPLPESTFELLSEMDLQGDDAERPMPELVLQFSERIAQSALFDAEHFAEQSGHAWSTKNEAIRVYLAEPGLWHLATSDWLDPAYLRGTMSPDLVEKMSPLEWYLRQGVTADIGPNPCFSNADYLLYARRLDRLSADGPSFFDDWLTEASTSAVRPCALIDMARIAEIGGDPALDAGANAVQTLRRWLAQPGSQRRPDRLSPYFDQDWLEQCYVFRRRRPDGCVLTAYRTGQMVDQAPHPVLQGPKARRDYYALIRAYERDSFAQQSDEVTAVCAGIDADTFYRQFPHVAPSQQTGSALWRYLTSNPSMRRPSFFRELDDQFVEQELPGLVDYVSRRRGIADINRIWARWIKLLGVPGNYRDSLRGDRGLLSLQNLIDLRGQKSAGLKTQVSFIVPSYARDDLVLRCLLSAIQSGRVADVEFLVAEDAAHIDCGWILGYFLPFATIHRNPDNLGFLRNCNAAADRARGDIVLLANNDVIVHKRAIECLLETFKLRPDAAVAGGLLLNANGTVQENGGVLWDDGSAWNYHRNWPLHEEFAFNLRAADYVSGCWFAVRRDVWREIGGFDEQFAPAYYEDSDFCTACWELGWKVYVNPASVVTHLDGATNGKDEVDSKSPKSFQKRNRDRFFKKWRDVLRQKYRKNARPTLFHTGRDHPEQSISIVFDHYVIEPDRDAGSRTMRIVCESLASAPDNYVLFVPANEHRSAAYAPAIERLGIEVAAGPRVALRLTQFVEQHRELVGYVFVSRIGVVRKYQCILEQLACQKSLYFHDIEPLRGFPYESDASAHRLREDAAVKLWIEQNHSVFALFDNLISLSQYESELLRPYLAEKLIDVAPYEHTSTLTHAQNATDLIFVGSYNHPPNREAVTHLCENLWAEIRERLPAIKLHLCGSGFESANLPRTDGIVLHGKVSEQTLDYLYSISRVAIAPLITGAGLKGKVLEAHAHGVPCVGTDVAWQGITLTDGYARLSGPMASFIDRLCQVYRDIEPYAGSITLANQASDGGPPPLREVILSLLLAARDDRVEIC